MNPMSSPPASVGLPTRLLAPAAVAFALLGAFPAWSAPLVVDNPASSVAVTFRQMNVPVDARFNTVDIVADFDPAVPGAARASITIETASFDFGPGAEEYNAEVRSPDWFDADKHPRAVLEVTGARALGRDRFEAIGELTIKGRTEKLTLPLVLEASPQRWVFSGQVPISRLAFGIGQGDWRDTTVVADEVLVRFTVVAAAP